MNSFPTSVLFTLLALVLVLVLAWLILRGLSKMNITKSRNGRIEVLDSVPMGTRERLVLVRCDEQEYLLGVTASSITRLDDARHKPGVNPD